MSLSGSIAHPWDVVIVGAGAAGCFAAIELLREWPTCKLLILEAGHIPLTKVKRSGGGRCNAMHHCFEIDALVKRYPRGHKVLKRVFSQFGPTETLAWFEEHGVALKTEPDGRMFPMSDDAQTIINCFLEALRHVPLKTQTPLSALAQNEHGLWALTPKGSTNAIYAEQVLLATGSQRGIWKVLEGLGVPLVAPVPSLFTPHIQDAALSELAGISVKHARVQLSKAYSATAYKSDGPLLITHWGFSGPAVLKWSAWEALTLASHGYKVDLLLDVIPMVDDETAFLQLKTQKEVSGQRQHKTDYPTHGVT